MRKGCEVCGREDQEVVGVAAVPAAAISVAWCAECLRNGAQPLFCVSVLLPDPPGFGPGGTEDRNPTIEEQIAETKRMGAPPEEHMAPWFLDQTVFVDGKYVRIGDYLGKLYEAA